MCVLDLGCGVGEVSLMAARLACRLGRVTAIDVDEAAAVTAGQEGVEQQGLINVQFVGRAIDEFQTDQPPDAVIGRHILIHSHDPLALLRKALNSLRKGRCRGISGIEFSVVQSAYPAWPLREEVINLVRAFLCRVAQGDIRGRLFHLFLEAGFSGPDCRVKYAIAVGGRTPVDPPLNSNPFIDCIGGA